MKFFSTALLLILIVTIGYSQYETPADVPMLLQQLSSVNNDTSRILLKCQLAEAYRENRPDSSLLLANETLSQSIRMKFKKGEIRSLIVLSVLSREKGDLSNALQLALKAVQLSKIEGLIYEEIYADIRVAVVYLSVADVVQATTYLKAADELLKIKYNEHQWGAVRYFLTEVALQENNLDEAERELKLLEQNFSQIKSWMVNITMQHAGIALKKGENEKAIANYRRSYQLALQGKFDREVATNSNALALVFKKTGQADSAIWYAKKGLQYGQMLSYKNRIYAASSLLADLYAEKDPASSVQYFQIATAARDSLYGVQKFMSLQSATLEELTRQAAIEKAQIDSQNKMKLLALGAGGTFFILIAFILYRNNRQKQKANSVLEKTLSDLKATQSQLIQSEKMASLGELTAGIAHEIQNPLNFINNFSEVSTELVAELNTEVDKGNITDVKAIANDLSQNLEKINHHGKRAADIVKGMLQHSRSSSGTKEPTDINVLCDEYLRLAYHGLRAKDKSFNAEMKTDFDSSVDNINIIQQDMGRVILNLINNAFYAVNEKAKQNIGGYSPTVEVSTKKDGKNVLISVKDNGNGIPDAIKKKIFQPFFTTKPTGQGTGLGLSLSYDIVKAHGGELQVETKQKEGSVFTIQLPIN